MPLTDYNKTKKLDVNSVTGTPSTDKAQPVLIRGEKGIDGFEDGDFTSNPKWVERVSQGTATVQSSTVIQGSNTVQVDAGGGNNHVLEYNRTREQISDGDTFQVWMRKTSVNDTETAYTLANSNDGDFRGLLTSDDGIEVRFSDGTLDVFTRDSSGSSLNSASGVVTGLSADTDYRFEIEFDTTNDEVTVTLYDSNDNSLGSTTLGYTGVESYKYVSFGVPDFPSSTTGYFDDVQFREVLSESDTGNGDIVIDFANISDAQDIAVYDQNGNLLDYEIENLDTTAETGVLWCYNSWVRDGTTQAQVAYGSNSQNVDRQNVTGTWGNTGQNAIRVYHLNNNLLTGEDSSPTGDTATVNGASSTDAQFDGGALLDGTDDDVVGSDFNTDTDFTVAMWAEPQSTGRQDLFSKFDPSFDGMAIEYDQGGNQQFRFRILSPSNNLQAFSSTYSTGNIYNVIQTWSESSEQLTGYVDGVQDGSTSASIGDSQDEGGNIHIGSELGTGNFFDGVIDAVRVYSDTKSSDWTQAEYDASPKAGQVFFSQQAAETTVTTENKTFSTDISIEDRDVTEQLSTDIIVENQNVPETFTQDVNVQATNQEQTLDTSITVQDENVEKIFTQDATVLNRDAEKTLSTDVSLELQNQTATFDQDLIISVGNIKTFDQTVVLKQLGAEKQFSQDIIIEDQIAETFTQDVAIAEKDLTATFNAGLVIADLDNEKTHSQDVYVSDRMEKTFSNDVRIARQPAPDVNNPLTVDIQSSSRTYLKNLNPSKTIVKVKDIDQ